MKPSAPPNAPLSVNAAVTLRRSERMHHDFYFLIFDCLLSDHDLTSHRNPHSSQKRGSLPDTFSIIIPVAMINNHASNQPSAVSQRKHCSSRCFFSGLTTLAVELSAFRLFAPVFGTSNLISAVVIGLILLYLSAGYLIGGRWADRSPNPITFYRIIAWGAFLVGLIPFVALPLLRLARDSLQNLGDLNVALIVLAFGVTLILFAVPVTLLGCVSPFAVRLSMHDVEQAGHVSGRLYAVSTLGSFIGSFLPELVLLDLFGTRGTFVVMALLAVEHWPCSFWASAR